MKQEIADIWVKALRSGSYEQGIGQLHDAHNRMCCLGVLAKLYANAHRELKIVTRDFGNSYLYDGQAAVLSPAIREWAGLKSPAGDIDGGSECLASLNDQLKTFLEIADVIEQRVEEL